MKTTTWLSQNGWTEWVLENSSISPNKTRAYSTIPEICLRSITRVTNHVSGTSAVNCHKPWLTWKYNFSFESTEQPTYPKQNCHTKTLSHFENWRNITAKFTKYLNVLTIPVCMKIFMQVQKDNGVHCKRNGQKPAAIAKGG